MDIDFGQIIQYIISPPFSWWLLGIKIGFIALTIGFIGFIIFALITSSYLKRLILWDLQEFFFYRPHGARKIVKDWQKIKRRLDTGLEAEYKLAVIEADSITDEILKGMGFGGKSLGERLDKLTAASLANLDDIRSAHQSRNNIVHDPDYKLSLDETKKVISVFEKSLIDLQAL